ncbi:MAG: hypothetical protein ACR2RL_05000 [Gammaproteobacteria bacterium]
MHTYDPGASIYTIDPTRTDLAAEFKANIRGPHSEELRRVLHRMRTTPLAGRYCVIVKEPFKEWIVGRLSGKRGEPPEIFEDRVFTSLDDVEWEVFRLRWLQLTGKALKP